MAGQKDTGKVGEGLDRVGSPGVNMSPPGLGLNGISRITLFPSYSALTCYPPNISCQRFPGSWWGGHVAGRQGTQHGWAQGAFLGSSIK